MLGTILNPQPEPEPMPVPTPAPVPEPEPEAEAEAVPVPVPEPEPVPKAIPEPDPTPTPTPLLMQTPKPKPPRPIWVSLVNRHGGGWGSRSLQGERRPSGSTPWLPPLDPSSWGAPGINLGVAGATQAGGRPSTPSTPHPVH